MWKHDDGTERPAAAIKVADVWQAQHECGRGAGHGNDGAGDCGSHGGHARSECGSGA
jgi:hypothetical protein